MRFFGYPCNDLVLCRDSPDYLVCSHFDYGMSIWTPHLMKYIKAIESVHRRATKMIPTIKDLSYSERLKKFMLKLPTLAYRRARGDMIEVYKIVTDILDWLARHLKAGSEID